MSAAQQSTSKFSQVRGRKCHLRIWGGEDAPPVLLLHGAMDTSASYQFVVDHLPAAYQYVAPDWCGYGRSEPVYCHWYPDYVADLDAIAQAISPAHPLDVVGHSRGGNAACLYAGARPERVRNLITIEGLGFSFARDGADEVTACADWLSEQRTRRQPRAYDSIEALAASLQRNNPRLAPERARLLAREGAQDAGHGKVRLASVFVPREKEGVRMTLDGAMAFWRKIAARVCYVYGDLSPFTHYCAENPAELPRRKACFSNWADVEIKGAGHMVQYDQPEQLAREIRRFLKLSGAAYC